MFTPGNHKLGGSLIWGFSLPSGLPSVCVGMSPACRADCYAAALERYRPAATRRYRANLRLSRRPDFARRARAFLAAHAVGVVRIHVGGDFHSAAYARKWLRVMRASPRVLFYFYTRSWRVPEIRRVIDRMAALPNCRAWYSADRDTGPPSVPPRARVAWLMAAPDDLPPAGTGLVFRVRRLRRVPAPAGVPTCPAEDGVRRPRAATCDECGFCWRPAPGGRFPLPVLAPDSPGGCP